MDPINIARPPTIREEVYKLLRQRILTGDDAPGTRLIEGKLADEMGTSRTPVREALHNLEMEHLIESIPRVGYVVRGVNEAEVDEIIEIRVALETLATRWAAERITKKELKRLEAITRTTARYVEKEETSGAIQLDTEFHDIICGASGSSRIVEMSQTLRDHMLRFRAISLGVTEIARRANEGHMRILEAIKGKDMQAIEESVRYHMDCTKRDIIENIRQKPKP